MSKRQALPRDRERGVAVLEFTLSLVFLAPLLMAALTFGYYFYVGSNAEEAARQGLKQASILGGGLACAAPPACNPAVNPFVTAPATLATCAAGTGPAAACYMHADPLFLGGASNTNVTCRCANTPVGPQYTIIVQVDFAPSMGSFRYVLPAGSGTNVRYTATIVGN